MKYKTIKIPELPEEHLRLHAGHTRVIDGNEMVFEAYKSGPSGIREVWVTPFVRLVKGEKSRAMMARHRKQQAASNIINRAMNQMGNSRVGHIEKRVAFHIAKGRSIADVVVRERWPASVVSEVYKRIMAMGKQSDGAPQ